MNIIYSYNNLKILLFCVIIPCLSIMVLYSFFATIYRQVKKDSDPNHTNYVINYWTDTLGIIFAAFLLSVSIGFSLAFIQTVRNLNAINDNLFLYYFFMVFPAIPLYFLLIYIFKFLKNMRNKELLEKEDD